MRCVAVPFPDKATFDQDNTLRARGNRHVALAKRHNLLSGTPSA
jgi:hypothetical protein